LLLPIADNANANMLEHYFSKRLTFDVFPMQTSDCHAVSLLHASRFSKGWNDGEIHSLISQPSVFGFIAHSDGQPVRGRPGGFVLARETAGEAEILTIAVDTKLARQSLGWRLMLAAIQEVRRRGGETLFLEVDENNVPAVALYHKLGFAKVGERKSYYTHADGQKSTALVMRLDLR
jgi:[ribosomal protein S18]-alanine N-acetyltransferase